MTQSTLLRPHHPLKTVEEVIADMPDAKMFSILDAKCGVWQVPLSKESSKLTTFMTGWFEIDWLPGTTSATLIAKLERHFVTHGVPQQLMTDNAAYFTSREFQEFARKWDFYHVTSSPLYPQSNGLAKHLLEKCAQDGTDIDAALLSLRNMLRGGLLSPAQCLLSLRTRAFIPLTKAMYYYYYICWKYMLHVLHLHVMHNPHVHSTNVWGFVTCKSYVLLCASLTYNLRWGM